MQRNYVPSLVTTNQAPLTIDGFHAVGDSDRARDGWSRLVVRRGTKALVSKGTQVLLVKERRSDGSTFWTLPGGGVEPGESLRACLRRELSEELLCRSSIGSLVGTCLYRHRNMADTVTLYAVFAAEPVTEFGANEDEGILACRWCDPTDPPSGLLVPFRRLLLDVDALPANRTPNGD